MEFKKASGGLGLLLTGKGIRRHAEVMEKHLFWPRVMWDLSFKPEIEPVPLLSKSRVLIKAEVQKALFLDSNVVMMC